jgi:ABC-2 type transport system permease protein
MISLIKWGLKQRKWFIFWWCFAIIALIFVNIAFYPSLKDQAVQLEQSFNQIPDSAKALFSDTGDLFSPVGYLSSQIFYLMLPMLLGILSIVLGSSLIAREEKETTIELLLSRPISRNTLVAGKAVQGLIIVSGAGLVALLATIGMAKLVELPVAAPNIALATVASTVLALSFGAIAYAVTMLGKARVASVGISTLIALGGYIIVSLIGAATWLKWPARALPFYYYKPAEILEGTYNWNNMLFILGIIIAAAILSVVAFRKRDLSS